MRNAGGVPKLWNRGYARASIIGKEPTMNPTPAAAFLLGMTPLAPKLHRSSPVRRYLLRRRHGRTANPVPAAIAISVGKSIAKKLGIKTGSPRYDGGPLVSTVAALLDAAKNGDLATVAQLHSLATSPGEKHRVQWAKVWNTELPQLEGALPAEVQHKIAQLDPTSVFAAREKEARTTSAAAGSRKAALAQANAERREALLAGVAGNVGKALLSRGRSLQQPRRRRRKRRS